MATDTGDIPEDIRRTLQEAEPEPAGERFVWRGAGFALDRTPDASDAAVAAGAAFAQDHAEAIKIADRLAGLVARRHNALTGAWDDLGPTVARFLAAIRPPTAELPAHAAAMFQAAEGLGSLLEQDDALRETPEAGEQPLPGDLRRLLGQAVTAAAVLVYALPSNQRRGGRLAAFWNADSVEAAKPVLKVAQDRAGLPEADVSHLRDLERHAARAGRQGEKARGRLVATARNWLLKVGALVVLPGAMSAYVNESPAMKSVAQGLVKLLEHEIPRLVVGLPANLAAALRFAAEHLSAQAQTPVALVRPPELPRPERDDPPPDFDLEKVKRMILAGQAPPAAWVPSITALSLSHTDLADLAPLAGLTSLHGLTLDHTRVVNLAPLAGLTSLQHLDVDGTRVGDITPLVRLTSLQSLGISRTQVADLAPLAGLISLRELHCGGTQVADLVPLTALTGLRKLRLIGTRVADLAPLTRLISLQELFLDRTKVDNVAPLAGLISLESIYLGGTQVADLAPLAGLTRTKNLWLNRTQVADLRPLARLTRLEQLRLDGTLVANLAPLAELTSLQFLDLAGTRASDLAPLAALTSLQTLYLNRTQVADLAPLAGLTDLKRLDLDDTQVANLAPLAGLPGLTVMLDGQEVRPAELARGGRSLRFERSTPRATAGQG